MADIKHSKVYFTVLSRKVPYEKTLKSGKVVKGLRTVEHKSFSTRPAAEAFQKTVPGSEVVEAMDIGFSF